MILYAITLKQALVVVSVVAGASIAYGTIKWDQAETRRGVAEIKKTQEAFMASNKVVANLNTLVVNQRAAQPPARGR